MRGFVAGIVIGALLYGCGPGGSNGDDAPAQSTSDTSTDASVPSSSADVVFLTVGDPVVGIAAADWQDPLDGWTYAFDISDPEQPVYLCQHDVQETLQKYAEWNIPTDPGCVVADPPSHTPSVGPDEPAQPDPPAEFPTTHGGLPGRNPVPPGQASWVGGASGGCGTWSIAMCDRILGRVDPTTQVSQGEWEQISSEIKLDPTEGSSNRVDRAAYYQARGYCVAEKRFDGTQADYEELIEKVNSGTCDVKAMFYRRLEDGTYTNGHVETVVGASLTGFLTNSWGHIGIVEGGSQGGFRHNGEGAWMSGAPGELWPPGSTEVDLQYVCPCTFFDSLGKLILGG